MSTVPQSSVLVREVPTIWSYHTHPLLLMEIDEKLDPIITQLTTLIMGYYALRISYGPY